jgi:hypothetical protein
MKTSLDSTTSTAGLRGRIEEIVRTFEERQALWRGVDRRRRAGIVKSMRRGQAVFDPRDAELAIAYARFVQRQAGRQSSGSFFRRFRLHVIVIALTGFLAIPAAARGDRFALLPLLVLLNLVITHLILELVYRKAA